MAVTAALSSVRRQRNYRLFFIGQSFAVIGTWMQTFATTWLVLRTTHSPEAVGGLALCQFLPFSVFGLFAGAVVERFDPHRLVAATQLALASCVMGLAVLTLTGWNALWAIYALAAIAGCVSVVDSPGRQAFTVQVVGREGVTNAIALNASLFSTGRVLGPALGGVVIAAVGVGACLVVSALAFVPLLVGLSLMRRSELHPTVRGPGGMALLHGTAEAVRYARRTPAIGSLLLVVLLLSTLSANVNVLVPLLAERTLRGGPQTFAAMSACLGAGSVVGGLITASRGPATLAAVIVGAAGMGVAELAIAPQASVAVVAPLLFALGASYTLWTANASAGLQLRSPVHLQGRVAGLYYFAFLAGSPLGGWLSGWLYAAGGAALAFGVAGGSAVAIALLAAVRLRGVHTSMHDV